MSSPLGATSAAVEGPPDELRYRHRVRLGPSFSRLWRARELVHSLAERDLRARYKQAVLGAAWAVLPPLATVVVFTVLFDRIAEIDTGGAPYALFSSMGLLPWTFFSISVGKGSTSLIDNLALLNKVSCPREVFPLTSIVVAGIDTLVAVGALTFLFVLTQYAPHATSVWVPVYVAVLVAFTVGVTLVLSVIVVYLRDVRHLLPLALQLALFATPVVYGLEVVSTIWKPYYVAVNPLAAVIDGLRRTVLFGQGPDFGLLAIAATSATICFVGGYVLFKRLEVAVADIA